MADANPKIVEARPLDMPFNQLFLYINECSLGYRPIGDGLQWTRMHAFAFDFGK
jgi:hypothetical protein